jgi:hypothetical protein
VNSYNQGFDDGKNDALAGKDKNYHGIPKLKAVVSSNSTDTYIEGYNEGYRKGKDEITKIK